MRKPCAVVSACLIGCHCRYDGKSNAVPEIVDAAAKYGWIPICPEILGGLPTPRVPSERRGDCVVAKNGADVTAAFEKGAAEAVRLARLYGAEYAVLKERSPSCGCGVIYDGTFTSTRIKGDGVTAQALKEVGITVFGESEAIKLIRLLEKLDF